jgi:hypothetical protein
MAKIVKDNSYNPFTIDPGSYSAVITAVEEKQGDFKGKPTRSFEWTFKIIEPTRDGEFVETDDEVTLRGFTPVSMTGKFSDKTKLSEWIVATGIDIDDAETFDTDELVGRRVGVFVEMVKKEKGTYCNITKVYADKKKRPAQEAPKAMAKPVSKPQLVEEVVEEEVEDTPPPVQQKTKPKQQATVQVEEEMFNFN